MKLPQNPGYGYQAVCVDQSMVLRPHACSCSGVDSVSAGGRFPLHHFQCKTPLLRFDKLWK
jgi:hypothetical protein